jgi:hypothetical protein
MTPAQCARCGRTTDQETDEFLYWEATDESGTTVICPGCLTGLEENQIADDAAETARLADYLRTAEGGVA